MSLTRIVIGLAIAGVVLAGFAWVILRFLPSVFSPQGWAISLLGLAIAAAVAKRYSSFGFLTTRRR